LDHGAGISCVNSSKLNVRPNHSLGTAKLCPPFNKSVVAQLAVCDVQLSSDEKLQVTAALTDKLDADCLLSLKDFNDLQRLKTKKYSYNAVTDANLKCSNNKTSLDIIEADCDLLNNSVVRAGTEQPVSDV